jgi:hypothetical protein
MTVCSYTRIGPAETETHCHLYRAVGSKFVSVESLLKTGVSAVWAGDFWEILAEVVIFRSLETSWKHAKSPQNAGFSPKEHSLSLVERMSG